jgi:hypothetical protein
MAKKKGSKAQARSKKPKTTRVPLFFVRPPDDLHTSEFGDALADAITEMIVKAENERRRKLGLPPMPKE